MTQTMTLQTALNLFRDALAVSAIDVDFSRSLNAQSNVVTHWVTVVGTQWQVRAIFVCSRAVSPIAHVELRSLDGGPTSSFARGYLRAVVKEKVLNNTLVRAVVGPTSVA